jgi:Flp pilus assembly protein TadG
MGIRARIRDRQAGKRERGAALAEFALMLPFLVLLLVGMIELGWGLAQQIDVRHKAREGLRLTIVDEPTNVIQNRICAGDIVSPNNVTVIDISSGEDVGTAVTVTVTADLQQLTGLFSPFWGSTPTITSTVEGRVEQPTSYASFIPSPACPSP